MTSSQIPSVLLIALSYLEINQQISTDLFSKIQNSANFIQISDPKAALFHLSDPYLRGIILADGDLTSRDPHHAPLLAKIVDFAKNGGTVVCCGMFSNVAQFRELDDWFDGTWSLPWKTSRYSSMEVFLNADEAHGLGVKGLSKTDSQKALALRNVAVRDIVYGLTRESKLQRLKEVDEAAVAFAKVGDGGLGYVGDVNSGKDTTKVVMAMLGLA